MTFRRSALPGISVVSLLILLLACADASRAQSTCAIRGTLTDPTGAALADTTIRAQAIDSAAKPVAITTGADGHFSLQLPPGDYRVTVTRVSFEPVEREFALHPGEVANWDVRMELATNSENVVVTASAQPAPAESSASPVDVISRSAIENRQELWLAPVLSGASGISMAQEGAYGGISTIFLDGGNSNFTKILIDGAPANQPGGDIDLEGLDVQDVDKIEIVHGATSALYGSD
ncbi:MAG: TonB-dependent receptor plug domain-containing protein, partial [Acidobacteriota bacterium]|nr:TonB-dependent receptor plug domain-containing protein [Acidobacteriota bacterium]